MQNQNSIEESDAALMKEINQAFDKLESGKASFIEHDAAKERMSDYKARIRNKAAGR